MPHVSFCYNQAQKHYALNYIFLCIIHEVWPYSDRPTHLSYQLFSHVASWIFWEYLILYLEGCFRFDRDIFLDYCIFTIHFVDLDHYTSYVVVGS